MDFWSINRWQSQSHIIITDDGESYVDGAIIIHPLSETPYQSSTTFQYDSPSRLQTWLEYLDSQTFTVCSIPQITSLGTEYPSLELLLFPCPNGVYYAAAPIDAPKHYVKAFDFSYLSPQRYKESVANFLEHGQKYIASAARRIWLDVKRQTQEE